MLVRDLVERVLMVNSQQTEDRNARFAETQLNASTRGVEKLSSS